MPNTTGYVSSPNGSALPVYNAATAQGTQTAAPTATALINPVPPISPTSQSGAQPTTQPTIPASNVTGQGVQPLNLPANTTGNTTAAYNQVIGSSQGALTGIASNAVGNAEANYQNSQNNVQGLINQYLGEGQDQTNMENAAGTPQLQAQANSLNAEYTAAQSSYNDQTQQILSGGGTLESRNAELQNLQTNSGAVLSGIGIKASLAQQNYTNAETIIQHQIQLKYAPLQDAIQYTSNILNNNKDILTQAQSQQMQADLQVQTQTYNNATYNDQLNASTGMQFVQQATANKAPQDVINQMSQLIASGASAADIAAAGGQYLSSGDYSYQFNPTTQQFAFVNSKTGLAVDGSSQTTVSGGINSINPADPSSSSIVTSPSGAQFNAAAYNGNTDPQYALKVQTATSSIASAVGTIDSAQKMQAAILTFSPNSPLDANAVYTAATQNGADPTLFAAQLKEESLFGTSNVAASNNNYGGVTYTGSAAQQKAGITQGTPKPASEGGYYAKFPTQQAGLDAEAKLVAGYQTTPKPNDPGQTQTIQQKIQNFQTIKTSLPANLSSGLNYIHSTGDSYIDLSKITDLPGYPTGSSKTQAEQYAKSLGFAVLDSSQVSAVQDYDTAMQKINTLQDQWNKIAPGGVAGKAADVITDPFSEMFDTQRGQDLVQYNANSAAAISTFNGIVGSKRLSQFTEDLSENALPQAPHSRSGLGFSNGDTITDGNLKLDNLRNDLNASLTTIDSTLTPAPLSSELPSSPLPQAGDIVMYGTTKVRYNADGSATVIQ